MKCTAYSRAERSSPADGVSSCKQSPRLSLSSAAPLKKHDVGRVFFNLCKVCLHKFVRFISKSRVEPVVCARCLFLQAIPHLRLPSAALWFILSQEPVGGGIVCLVFQLEDIVDFPLIHRPYGFIVQFLMINTGNGGSFVQL